MLQWAAATLIQVGLTEDRAPHPFSPRVLSPASLRTESSLSTPGLLLSTEVVSESQAVNSGDDPAAWSQIFSSHSVESMMPVPTGRGGLCMSGDTVYTFGRLGSGREVPASPVHTRNVSFHCSVASFLCSAHPHVGIKINSHNREPIYTDWVFVPSLELSFFWKCSNLHKSYKNSTVSTSDLDPSVNVGHFCFLSLNMYVLLNHYSGTKAPKTLACPPTRKRTFCCVTHYCHQS